jgi:hypothetical protein
MLENSLSFSFCCFLTICITLLGFLKEDNRYSVKSIFNSLSFCKCSYFKEFSLMNILKINNYNKYKNAVNV